MSINTTTDNTAHLLEGSPHGRTNKMPLGLHKEFS